MESALPKAPEDRRADIVAALDAVPDLLGLMQRHTAEIKLLQTYQKEQLLRQVCDESKRADVDQLGRDIFPKWDQFSMRDFEWCVKERKALEPELKAFLDSAQPAAKASQGHR